MTNTTVNTAATSDTVEEMVIVPVRESVAVEIHALLDNIGASYLKVGSLLNEARADFEAQKEFLAWAESEFSIKKAQCYNLMNVARVFDGNGKFKGVAMRVMLALVSHADDAEIMDKAAEMAMDGKLDTAAVNALTGKQRATPTNEEVEDIEQAQAAQAGAQASESQPLQALPAETTAGDDAPFDTDERTATPAAPLANASNAENERTAALLDTIKQLNQQIADMQAALNERTSERETRKSAAPLLPQFKSKCMYARLGLSAEEAEKKTSVNKARRDLVKLGYGEGHEAYALICEAVEALTK
ncbi:hypothetical protein phD2B_007 [Lelliottia phage phD2B]|uniref:Uncharacterized protein n=1 Tax=Lelliottia phage phD2B TaxID=1542498 RepID=A0A088FWW5_9CAUD|nr:hypothetical protein phD2B_007 [Lelliottia phage phD2B]AIM51234.1 hypothetical protein phD2B_007 [Lelliottia phage phD2B]